MYLERIQPTFAMGAHIAIEKARYVLQGSATLVTGGKAVATKSTGPEELRGSEIEGG